MKINVYMQCDVMIFRSASSSRDCSCEKIWNGKISKSNNLFSPANTCTLVRDSSRQSQKVPDSPRQSKIVPDSHRQTQQSQTVTYSQRQSQRVPDSSRQSNIVPDRSRQPQIVQDSSRLGMFKNTKFLDFPIRIGHRRYQNKALQVVWNYTH